MSTHLRAALLITPAFFGYEHDIVSELERQGYATTLLDERPSNGALIRAILRVRKDLVGRFVDSYYRKKATELDLQEFDIIVVVKAEVVPRWFLQRLRERNPQGRFVFYTYDAIDNSANCLNVVDLFDTRLSFDRQDVSARPDFNYLPLFYTREFRLPSTATVKTTPKYSLSFVGTLHSGRYAFVKKLFSRSHSTFGFFFVQARWYFAVTKYLTREHRSVPWGDVSFTPLNRQEIATIFRNSFAVLDMQRSGQAGLTMRSFEVLASGSVLVTTNRAIAEEPFYDPERIIIVPEDLNSIDVEHLLSRLQTMTTPSYMPDGFDAYSLSAWVHQLVA